MEPWLDLPLLPAGKFAIHLYLRYNRNLITED